MSTKSMGFLDHIEPEETKTHRVGLWETGGLDEESGEGVAIVVCNADGSRPQTYFVKANEPNGKHVLVAVEAGSYVIYCHYYARNSHSYHEVWRVGKCLPKSANLGWSGPGLEFNEVGYLSDGEVSPRDYMQGTRAKWLVEERPAVVAAIEPLKAAIEAARKTASTPNCTEPAYALPR